MRSPRESTLTQCCLHPFYRRASDHEWAVVPADHDDSKQGDGRKYLPLASGGRSGPDISIPDLWAAAADPQSATVGPLSL